MKKVRSSQASVLVLNWVKHSFSLWVSLKQVEDIKDVCLLRKMFDVIETRIRSLENLGYKVSSYGLFLIPVIANNLLQELNLFISRQFGFSGRWEIEQVLKVSKTEISAHEKTSVVLCYENEIDGKENPITAASLITRSSFITQKKKKKCVVPVSQQKKPIELVGWDFFYFEYFFYFYQTKTFLFSLKTNKDQH